MTLTDFRAARGCPGRSDPGRQASERVLGERRLEPAISAGPALRKTYSGKQIHRRDIMDITGKTALG